MTGMQFRSKAKPGFAKRRPEVTALCALDGRVEAIAWLNAEGQVQLQWSRSGHSSESSSSANRKEITLHHDSSLVSVCLVV